MSKRTTAVFAIILAIALIIVSADKISNVNKSATASSVTKIVWDILGVLLIIGGVGAVWQGFKAMRTA